MLISLAYLNTRHTADAKTSFVFLCKPKYYILEYMWCILSMISITMVITDKNILYTTKWDTSSYSIYSMLLSAW
jgi:hypothetical protein